MAIVKREGNKISIQHSDKMREVGEIKGEMPDAVLYVYRDESKHLMLVWNAYGFAKEVMDRGDWFSYIMLTEKLKDGSEREYIIPREEILSLGKEYESSGFERQYFVGREKIQKYLRK